MSSLNLPGLPDLPDELESPAPDTPQVAGLIDDKVYLSNNYGQESNPLLSNMGEQDIGALGVFQGITMIEASNQMQQGLAQAENSMINRLSGMTAVTLDFLAVYDDPIGYVAGQLLSWMLEHVEPLRLMLDQLAGSPDMIRAYARSWEKIGTELVAVVDEYKHSVTTRMQSFTGQAGDAYRARAADMQNLITAAASATDGIERLTLAMAEVVAGVRTAVRDIIAGLAGSLVSDAIMCAVVGPGTAAGIAKALKDIATAIVKSCFEVDKIAKALDDVLLVLVVLRDLSDGIAKGTAVMIE